MKSLKYLNAFVFLFCIGLISAQSYHPIIKPGKQFDVYWNCYQPCPGSYNHEAHYFFDKDSTINGKTYQQFWRYTQIPAPGPLGKHLVALLREDSAARIIYQYNQNEQVLFDFNLTVGDSVYFDNQNGWLTITDIDTSLLADNTPVYSYLSSDITFSPTTQDYHLFSTSIMHGLLFPGGNNAVAFPTLTCAFGLNGIPLFGSCDTARYIGLPNTEITEFELYPNPATSSVKIVAAVKGDFALYDILGKIVLQPSISADEQNTLSVANLPAGLYVWVFRTEKGVEKGKLLIQD
jgi:hypothetical protein